MRENDFGVTKTSDGVDDIRVSLQDGAHDINPMRGVQSEINPQI